MGEAYAIELAKQKINLILVDKRKEELEKTAEKLRNEFKIEVETIPLDINAESVCDLIRTIKDKPISIAVLNHSITEALNFIRPFSSQELQFVRQQIDINITSITYLAHHFANEFLKQNKKGAIILVSTLKCNSGNGGLSVYSASKSYLLNLGESLHFELKEKKIDVIVSLMGATSTPTLLSEITPQYKLKIFPATQVAKETLNALGKTSVVIPTAYYKAINHLFSTISREKATKILSDENITLKDAIIKS